MAPRRENRPNLNSSKQSPNNLKTWIKNNLQWKEITALATDPRKIPIAAVFFILLEIAVNVLVIEKVPYTEIDWKAYMQEVEGFLNGTLDYYELKGDTGPLVYPAGFVYIFSALYYLTSFGANIKLAQYIFAIFYIVQLILVFRIYARTKKIPPYVLILICCTSYRIHSIFILRLFGDPIAVLFLFASINAFIDERWYIGSILYSLAVSVKMNILLFAPALLIAYLTNLGLFKTAVQLSICAIIQLILGLPFLLSNPIAYINRSFDFGRIFEFKWTVNWRFLPEEIFVNRYFHISLLVLHLLTLAYFAPSWIKYLKSYCKLKFVEKNLKPQLRKKETVDTSTVSQLFILPLFMSNLIGVAFSRSLHYQFYIWYYHTLPYLVWCCDYKTVTRLVILGIIEMCWNTYPSTIYSSAALHVCHIVLMYGLHKSTTKALKNV